jgi:hypothetical protein
MWPRDFPFLIPPSQPAYVPYVNMMYAAGFTGEELGYPDSILTKIACVIWADQHAGKDSDANKIVAVVNDYEDESLWFLETVITFCDVRKAKIAQELHEQLPKARSQRQQNHVQELIEQLYREPARVTFTTPTFLRGDGIHNDGNMPVIIKGLTRTLEIHVDPNRRGLVCTKAPNRPQNEVVSVWLFS